MAKKSKRAPVKRPKRKLPARATSTSVKKVKPKAVKRAGSRVLVKDLSCMIEEARGTVAQQVNSVLVALYWRVGQRLRTEVLGDGRAEYGERIVSAVGRQLSQAFGAGFSEKGLRHMLRFVEAFPDERIVSALGKRLSWTHFRHLIYVEDALKRSFYAELCHTQRWSTRTLAKQMDALVYERTALSRKSDKLVRTELSRLKDGDRTTPDLVFRDPYLLDFLNLQDGFSEHDLEQAILREMERFLLELGEGFTFVARQKRITIDNEDFHLDLLFYHRHLRRLVAIELKLEPFKAAHKGQMELYLRWLNKHERARNEEEPIGLILCSGKKREQIELLELDKSGIRVAEYLTQLPAQQVLRKRLHQAIATAKALGEGRED